MPAYFCIGPTSPSDARTFFRLCQRFSTDARTVLEARHPSLLWRQESLQWCSRPSMCSRLLTAPSRALTLRLRLSIVPLYCSLYRSLRPILCFEISFAISDFTAAVSNGVLFFWALEQISPICTTYSSGNVFWLLSLLLKRFWSEITYFSHFWLFKVWSMVCVANIHLAIAKVATSINN